MLSTTARIRPLPVITSITNLRAHTISTMEHMWAASTWKARRSLWARLLQFSTQHCLDIQDGMTAPMFLEHLNISIQSKLTYGKTLMSLYPHMGYDTTSLNMYLTGLRGQGATVPIRQATPITKDDLTLIIESLPPRLATAIRIAWKCAARWDEVSRLTRDQFVQVSATKIIIYWGTKTKTTRMAPFRPDMLTTIVGPWTREIAAVISALSPRNA
jgi:integrase